MGDEQNEKNTIKPLTDKAQFAIEQGTFGLVWVPRNLMVADIGNQPQTYAMHKTFTEVLRGQRLPERETAAKSKKRKHVSIDDEGAMEE